MHAASGQSVPRSHATDPSVMIDTLARRLWERDPSRFSSTPTGVSGGALGFPNMANTAPLPWGDRLFATWDGGRPV